MRRPLKTNFVWLLILIQAAKAALAFFLKNCSQRERDVLKSVEDAELYQNLLGDVTVNFKGKAAQGRKGKGGGRGRRGGRGGRRR